MKDNCQHFRFFTNRECEYFPCHRGVDPDRFNCLFCSCPLYTLGSRCGGNFRWTEKGVKDCKECTFPHHPENYRRITERFREISALAEGNR